MRYRVPCAILDKTFGYFRRCGAGRRECQALWISAWRNAPDITEVVHPRHSANAVGFDVEDAWIDGFWDYLAATDSGIRVQIHTHPGAAFHSATDDAYPISRRAGFLSLVIPNFGLGPPGFESAFLVKLDAHGTWRHVPISRQLTVV